MNKLYQFFFWISVLLLSVIYACEKDENGLEDDKGNFRNGVFIINEGNFTDKDGSISWYDFDSSKVILKVYEIANEIPFAGTLQSIAFNNEKGYFIDNSGRLEIVDEKTFLALNRLTDFDIPRYMAFSGNKGYVTDWGPYGLDFSSTESTFSIEAENSYVENQSPLSLCDGAGRGSRCRHAPHGCRQGHEPRGAHGDLHRGDGRADHLEGRRQARLGRRSERHLHAAHDPR